jgi:outer membrane lipoprotein carrier protein
MWVTRPNFAQNSKMKIQNLFRTALVVLLFVNSAFAQNSKDPKATEILKGVSNKYKSLKSYSASFKVTTLDQKNKATDTQTGSLTVKGAKYRLSIKGQEVISDGKTVWTYLKESNEVQINDVAERSDAISPTSIFTIYEKGFSSKFMSESKNGSKTNQLIELVPDDKKKPYFKIQITVSKEDKMLSSAKIFDKNGTHLTYSIEKFNANAEAPDQLFTFDSAKYPGVEVVDLR